MEYAISYTTITVCYKVIALDYVICEGRKAGQGGRGGRGGGPGRGIKKAGGWLETPPSDN